MTRRHLRRVLSAVIVVYALAIGAAILLRMPFHENASSYYRTYRDVLPLMIAIPAAYLAFAFQRRHSYLQALRALWTHMVSAISAALVYTETVSPTQDQYRETLGRLSVAIEEVRGVFENVPAPGAPDGWYPFEPVKQIYQEIRDLGFGPDATAEKRAAARDRIYAMWKRSRSQLLAEFDRERPTYHHAEYAPYGPPHGASASRRHL